MLTQVIMKRIKEFIVVTSSISLHIERKMRRSSFVAPSVDTTDCYGPVITVGGVSGVSGVDGDFSETRWANIGWAKKLIQCV